MLQAAEGAYPLPRQGLQTPQDYLGKREAMAELVTSHGLSSTQTTNSPTTPAPTPQSVVVPKSDEAKPEMPARPQSEAAGGGTQEAGAPVPLVYIKDQTPIKPRSPTRRLKQVALATL